MKAIIVSDLHLESSNISINTAGADALFVVGDLSVCLEAGFDWMCRMAPDIPRILVPGNHEYEGKDFDRAEEKMRKLAKEYDCILLQNESVVLGSVSVLGTTLWSGFNLFPQWKSEAMRAAKFNVCDFSTIFRNGKCITVEDMEAWHLEACAWLDAELAAHKLNKTVVLSHFAPFTPSLSPAFEHDIVSAYWINRLDEQFGGRADYWFHGHCHRSSQYDMHGTKVFCNPRGSTKFAGLSDNPEFTNLIVDL